MQPHKNKVIETNNAESRKHTHTQTYMEVKTLTEIESDTMIEKWLHLL